MIDFFFFLSIEVRYLFTSNFYFGAEMVQEHTLVRLHILSSDR